MLEIRKAVVVVVFIFLKHNGLCGQAMSSSLLCSQSITCTIFRARVTPFACTVGTVHAICEGLHSSQMRRIFEKKN